jgi:hypothetical protein
MRRTIAVARRTLEEDIAPDLNDGRLRQAQEVLAQAEAHARETAGAYLDRHEAELQEVRQSALRELTEVGDAFDALVAEGAEGRIYAKAYAERLDALRQRHAQADDALAKVAEQVERFEGIEDDPVGFYDELASRLEHMKVDFPW